MKMVTEEHLHECYAALRARAETEIEQAAGDPDAIGIEMLRQSLDGDPTFLNSVAERMANTLTATEINEISATEKLWLVLLLKRIVSNPAIALMLSGKKGRGRPKNGAKSFDVALGVFNAIMDGGATSVADAWEMVAERRCLDVSTVQKCWMKWRPMLREGMAKSVSTDGIIGLDGALKAMIKANLEGKKGGK